MQYLLTEAAISIDIVTRKSKVDKIVAEFPHIIAMFPDKEPLITAARKQGLILNNTNKNNNDNHKIIEKSTTEVEDKRVFGQDNHKIDIKKQTNNETTKLKHKYNVIRQNNTMQVTKQILNVPGQNKPTKYNGDLKFTDETLLQTTKKNRRLKRSRQQQNNLSIPSTNHKKKNTFKEFKNRMKMLKMKQNNITKAKIPKNITIKNKRKETLQEFRTRMKKLKQQYNIPIQKNSIVNKTEILKQFRKRIKTFKTKQKKIPNQKDHLKVRTDKRINETIQQFKERMNLLKQNLNQQNKALKKRVF